MTKRFLRYSGLGLAVFTVGALAACGSSDDNNATNSAAGSGVAGAHAGGNAGGAGGNPDQGPPTNTGGAATAGNGGASAGYTCTGATPVSSTITDFSDLVANPTNAGNYSFMSGVPGGTFTYQPNALTLATGGNALEIKGNVHDYDGFGVYFNSCTDASAYSGVSFTIKGNAGPSAKLNFRIQTNSDTAVDVPDMKGSCVVPTGADSYASCHSAGFDIAVSPTATTVTVNFSQLADGYPVTTLTGNEILGLEWAFDWTPPAAGSAGAPGASAGAGGTSGGGAGGASAGTGGANAGSGGASAGTGGSAGKGGAGGSAGASGGAGGASAGSGGANAGSGGANAGSGGANAGSGGAAGGASVVGAYDADITISDIKFIGGPPAGGAGGAGGTPSAGTGGTPSAGSGGASAGSGGTTAGAGGTPSAGSGGASAGAGGSAGAKAGAGGTAGHN